jgi:hypothetical protein
MELIDSSITSYIQIYLPPSLLLEKDYESQLLVRLNSLDLKPINQQIYVVIDYITQVEILLINLFDISTWIRR